LEIFKNRNSLGGLNTKLKQFGLII